MQVHDKVYHLEREVATNVGDNKLPTVDNLNVWTILFTDWFVMLLIKAATTFEIVHGCRRIHIAVVGSAEFHLANVFFQQLLH
jgi:hypothetical protein